MPLKTFRLALGCLGHPQGGQGTPVAVDAGSPSVKNWQYLRPLWAWAKKVPGVGGGWTAPYGIGGENVGPMTAQKVGGTGMSLAVVVGVIPWEDL
jgi:hypothetical protein